MENRPESNTLLFLIFFQSCFCVSLPLLFGWLDPFPQAKRAFVLCGQKRLLLHQGWGQGRPQFCYQLSEQIADHFFNI